MEKKSAQLDNVTTAIKIEAIFSVVSRMINYESCDEKMWRHDERIMSDASGKWKNIFQKIVSRN